MKNILGKIMLHQLGGLTTVPQNYEIEQNFRNYLYTVRLFTESKFSSYIKYCIIAL
jgi:hypothetical protein